MGKRKPLSLLQASVTRVAHERDRRADAFHLAGGRKAAIMRRRDLTPMDKLVFLVIEKKCSGYNTATLDLKTIAEAVGGGTRTVTRSVAALEAAEVITIERGVKQRYQLQVGKIMDADGKTRRPKLA